MTRGFEYVGMSCKKSSGLLLCNDRSGAETTGTFSAHTATYSTNESAHETQSFSPKSPERPKNTGSIISGQESPSISDLPCLDLLSPALPSSSVQPRNRLLFSFLPDNRQQTVDFPLQSSQWFHAELPRH